MTIGSDTFIHKGINGRWRDMLTKEDSDKYEKLVAENLDAACAKWLATGEI